MPWTPSIIQSGGRRRRSIDNGRETSPSIAGQALSKSHKGRRALLTEQLTQAGDEKLQRMRRSQIAAAEADYTRRIQELDTAMERADIVAQPVAYGVIELSEGD